MPNPNALDEYRRRHPQPCANLEADTMLPGADHDRFVLYLESYHGGDYDDYLNIFFGDESNKKLGPPVDLEANEVLGAVRAMSSFASRFTTANGLDQDPLNAEDLVRDLALLPRDNLVDTLHMLFEPGSTIAPFLMWSYRNPPYYDDPFLDMERDDLPCRLALPSYGMPEHVAFGHRLAPAPFVPTSFDAELANEWRPGGYTRPLADCEAKYANGLPEVVHDSNVFHNLATALYLV